MKRFSVFLITAALVGGIVGCDGESYALVIASTEGGSVTMPGEGTFTYEEGTVVNLSAEVDECYHFVSWTGNVSNIAHINATSTNIIMNSHYSITANFEEHTVVFPDPNLESAIRESIGEPIGPIYCVDLKGLTYLYAITSNITDLTGLEYCTSLTILHLANNHITDISPLVNNEGLSNGDYVQLVANPLSPDSINIYIPQLEARGVTVYY